MDQYCRLCSLEGTDHYCLYDDGQPNAIYKLVEKYFFPEFFQVKWSNSFKYICRQCSSSLLNFNVFHEIVCRAQSVLKELDTASIGTLYSNDIPLPHSIIKSEKIDELLETENSLCYQHIAPCSSPQGNHGEQLSPILGKIKQEKPEDCKNNEFEFHADTMANSNETSDKSVEYFPMQMIIVWNPSILNRHLRNLMLHLSIPQICPL
ncbi:uncharacterized protein [Musca autumnalis]|uniref:uncharacterized protein n=1 Tax=Musca autumnalis TaxID=221902 RepID=UPI003CF604D6